MNERDPRPKRLDIENSQIDEFKVRWDGIDPEKYTSEGMRRLRSQGALLDHLAKRAAAIEIEQAPNDKREQPNIARDFILGAVFADEVVNTIPGLDQEIDSNDLDVFHSYFSRLFHNSHSSDNIAANLPPNLRKLMIKILKGRELKSKNYIGTGFIEMFWIKFTKSLYDGAYESARMRYR